MTPTRTSLSHVCRALSFCFLFFLCRVLDRIFDEFWLPAGSEKSTNVVPGAEKVRSRSALFAIFGVNFRFLRFSVDLEPKNDEKSMFFWMRFCAAERFFFNPANLDFDWQAQYFRGFGDFQKNTIFQKNVAKIVLKTDRWKTS